MIISYLDILYNIKLSIYLSILDLQEGVAYGPISSAAKTKFLSRFPAKTEDI